VPGRRRRRADLTGRGLRGQRFSGVKPGVTDGADIVPIAKEDYQEWRPVRLADPREATLPQLISGMRSIVEAEGPVMAGRVFHIFSKAGGLNRIYDATRRNFIAGLQAALKAGVFLAEKETPDEPSSWVLRLPAQKPVRVRSLGGRTLHEVPATEIAEIMLEIRVGDELVSREELSRKVLAEYGLIRLTEATKSRLDHVLKTWF